MKISVFALMLLLINRIRSEFSNTESINLCENATDVSYKNYTNAVTQNCGCENRETCVRKCCRKGFFHNHDEDVDGASYMEVCSKHDSGVFSVPLYEDGENVSNETENFLVGMLNCNETSLLYVRMDGIYTDNDFYVQSNGSLYFPRYDLTLDNERYCIDEGDELTAYLCIKSKVTSEMETIIHVTAKLISLPFLMATGLVYALLPDRNLHRTSLMLHVFSLLLGNGLIAIGQYTTVNDETLCFCMGYSILLFMVASFFWMNVMCIDIWLAFSGLRGFYVQEKIKRRIFAIASLYAWGLPILNGLIVFLVSTYGDENADYYPGIGVKSCFLRNGLPTCIFYFGPILIIILINIGFFILTAFYIQKVKKETKIVEDSQSKKHSNKDDDKLKLYWKLLFVMGLNPVVNTHLIQMISWYLGGEFKHNVVVYVWYYKDFSHAAYGILIFIIFVCQKKIWRSLKKRFPCNSTINTKSSVTTSTVTTSSESDPSALRLRGIQNKAADVP